MCRGVFKLLKSRLTPAITLPILVKKVNSKRATYIFVSYFIFYYAILTVQPNRTGQVFSCWNQLR